MFRLSRENISREEGRVAIICGSAPSLFDEYDEAVKNIDNPITIVVNNAASGIAGDYLCTFHWELMKKFRLLSKNKNIISVACSPINKEGQSGDEADYWCPEATSGGTSVGCAILFATLVLGVKKIYLCGAPMNGGDGYFHDCGTPQPGIVRFGAVLNGFKDIWKDKQNKIIRTHQRYLLEDINKRGKKEIVRSLSGWTMQQFGGPEWRQK